MSPDGLTYNDTNLPHAKTYANPKGAVVQAWRCVRWFTNLCLVESQDKDAQTLTFDPKVGIASMQVHTGCHYLQPA